MEIAELDFWKNKNVLITGHTGFKGSWLCTLLNYFESNICGISLDPLFYPNLFDQLSIKERISESHILDISNIKKMRNIIEEFNPEIIFHMAAQPLVLESYKYPLETWQTNVMGTANLLENLKILKNNYTLVVITTDKVYENKEWVYGYRENDKLGGYDPYSASKAAAEILIDSWRNSFCQKENLFRTKIATARAGNVIGGGDWSQYRLIPDAIKSIMAKEPIKLRNPNATRPWQHVLEPLNGYLKLARKLYLSNNNDMHLESSFNFGPEDESCKQVSEVIQILISKWEGQMHLEGNLKKQHEAGLLKLDISKAKNTLQWKPKWNFETTIDKTLTWYKNVLVENHDPFSCCLNDIKSYLEI